MSEKLEDVTKKSLSELATEFAEGDFFKKHPDMPFLEKMVIVLVLCAIKHIDGFEAIEIKISMKYKTGGKRIYKQSIIT